MRGGRAGVLTGRCTARIRRASAARIGTGASRRLALATLALKRRPNCVSATVPAMSPPVPHRRARSVRPPPAPRPRARACAALPSSSSSRVVALVTLLLSAFGGSRLARRRRRRPRAPRASCPPGRRSRRSSPGSDAAPAAPGQPVARDGDRLPGRQRRLARARRRSARRRTKGSLKRLVHSIFGGSSGRPRWYQLPGGDGPSPSAIDVGARAGHRRLLAGRRDDRRDRRRRPERRGVRLAHRHPAVGRTVARRLGLARARRPVARGRLAGHRRRLEARLRRRLHARASARRSRATRTTRGTTSSSRCIPRRRWPSARSPLNILFVADVFGAPGRRAVEERLPSLREELAADFCIVNGENAAAGRGITAKLADKLLASGADVVTLGNWTWGQQGFAPYLSGTRPRAPPGEPVAADARCRARRARRGRGDQPARHLLARRRSRTRSSPPTASSRKRARETPVIVVDFHAEATSEKVALARYLDGRVTAVLGTHTHVQTSDARVLAGGTAAITDAGMTGPHDSVIGSDEHNAIKRFVTGHADPARAATRRRAHRRRARRVRRGRPRYELRSGSRAARRPRRAPPGARAARGCARARRPRAGTRRRSSQ